MAYTPAWWGPRNGIDSKDYVLYMQGANGVTDVPVSLLGHALTSPNQNLTDALQFVETVLRNGRVRTISRTKRAAYETSRTYTVGFPSALWTPLMERTIRGGCTTTMFLYFQCPEEPIYAHVEILPDATLNPAIEAEDVITTGEDTNVITFQSEMQVPEKIRQWALGYEIIYTVSNTELTDIALMTEDCPGCDFVAGQGAVIVGGDGTAAPIASKTDDRFGSVTSIPSVGAAEDVAQAVFTEGDLIIISNLVPGDGGADDAGELYVSRDRGASVTKLSGFTAIIRAFAKLGNTIIAVGHSGAGAGKLYISEDQGNSFTEITASAVAALTNKKLLDVAVDNVTGRIYMVGETGTMLVGRLAGSSMTVSDISANTGASTNDINTVAVLTQNHVVIGGASGFAAESRDGGVNFVPLDVPGSSDIASIDGNQYRTVIGAGNKVYERSIMTKNAVQEVVLENGQTLAGDVTKVVMGLEDNMNQFFILTDKGEVVLGRGHYPNA